MTRNIKKGPAFGRAVIIISSIVVAVTVAAFVFVVMASVGFDLVDTTLACGIVLLAMAELAGIMAYRAQSLQQGSSVSVEKPVADKHRYDNATNRTGGTVSANRAPQANADRGETASRAVGLKSFIKEKRGELYLEPIIDLIDRRTCHYLASLRGRLPDGRLMSPQKVEQLVGKKDDLDALALETISQATAAQFNLKEQHRPGRIFCPLWAKVLADDRALERIVNMIGDIGSREAGIVLSVVGMDVFESSPDLAGRIMNLARHGLGLAVEIHETATENDPTYWARGGVDFLTMGCGTAIGLAGRKGTTVKLQLAQMVETARTAGLEIIITGVEFQEVLRDLVGYRIMACGPVFAPARPVKLSVNSRLQEPPDEKGGDHFDNG
ncbi:MAG: EAL domain-containing protein [Hyphomicrobiales bacterium]